MREVFIYGLKDPNSNRVRYIGKSVNPNNRFYEHINNAIKAKNKTYKERWICKLLKNSKKPILEILFTTNEKDFEYWEEFFIKKYKNLGFNLLNFDDKGKGMVDKIKTQVPKSMLVTSRTVYQYDLNGILLNIFKSTRQAARETKLSHSNISRCCNKKWKHTGGFLFFYEPTNSQLSSPNAVRKKVVKVSKDGSVLDVYNSIAEAAKNNNVDGGNVSKVCNNKLKSIKGLIFKFKEN